MDTLTEASDLLAEAERALRGLIERSMRSESYGALAELARLAEGLAQLRLSFDARSDRPPREEPNADSKRARNTDAEANGAAKPRSESKSRAVEYPRFLREGDRLVKVGWSDRDKQAYEHRASKAAVFRVCDEINKRSLRAKRFRMENVLSELASSHDPLPTYQAYLTLAWLRSVRAVDRDGKDGYRVNTAPLSQDRVAAIWEAVEERP